MILLTLVLPWASTWYTTLTWHPVSRLAKGNPQMSLGTWKMTKVRMVHVLENEGVHFSSSERPARI